MSDTKIIFIPSMSLTYEDNMLEVVGIGGELYKREERMRGVVSYEEGYADGFDRGEAAIIQQVDGIISDKFESNSDVVYALIDLIAEFWEERES